LPVGNLSLPEGLGVNGIAWFHVVLLRDDMAEESLGQVVLGKQGSIRGRLQSTSIMVIEFKHDLK
ncbi:MAG: hypothetical protein DSZ02_10925, partial [Gammaproteobacteria bacterium]